MCVYGACKWLASPEDLATYLDLDIYPCTCIASSYICLNKYLPLHARLFCCKLRMSLMLFVVGEWRLFVDGEWRVARNCYLILSDNMPWLNKFFVQRVLELSDWTSLSHAPWLLFSSGSLQNLHRYTVIEEWYLKPGESCKAEEGAKTLVLK